ncbi:hypothetical protein ACJX0J_019688, partial [Zea mays]
TYMTNIKCSLTHEFFYQNEYFYFEEGQLHAAAIEERKHKGTDECRKEIIQWCEETPTLKFLYTRQHFSTCPITRGHKDYIGSINIDCQEMIKLRFSATCL